MNDEEDEITVWMGQLAGETPQAMSAIWDAYFQKLASYAKRRMASYRLREADEEDVALSAMASLYQGARKGRFPDFDSRDDLWRILLTIASRKVKKRVRHEMAEKRGGGALRGESVFVAAGGGIGEAIGREPTPEFAEQVGLATEDLLQKLGDGQLREIALMRLEGYTVEEIAQRQDSAPRSIERKLQRIRAVFRDDVDSQAES